MAALLNVLIVEDSEDDCALLLRVLRQTGYEIHHQRVDSADGLRSSLDQRQWNLVISDFSMPNFNGTAALSIVRERDPDTPFIFFSGTIGEDTAVSAMRMGAQDFVLKNSPARLLPAIQRELADAEVRREHKMQEQRLRHLEKFEALGKLAGGIAHDFNNVLGAIMGWSELGIEKASGNAAAVDYFRRIQEQSERAAGLTRQLLAYARRQILQRQNIDLNVVVSQAMELLERLIGAHISIQKTLAVNLGHANADPTQIEQVLLNLCFNARDAMPDGGTLRIETRDVELNESYCRQRDYVRPGHYVALTVTDTGTGMTAETIGKIFEPFFTTKEVGRGTGLGLATAFGIVRQHQGHIDVESEVGKGSTFHVYLPRNESAAREDNAAEQTEARGGTETILVAEDHQGLREMSKQVLRDLGYRVVTASDGEEAIVQFQKRHNEVSLVVLDVVMPRLGGPDVYAKLRDIKPGIPVIFTTGYSERGDALRAIAASAPTSILQKPYPPKILARKIREMLDGAWGNRMIE